MVKGSICMLTKAASKSVENTKESKKKFKPLDLLTFVRIICKSFICRKISWSSVFLSDALQMMSPKLGTLLLRIFLSFTRIINDRACDEEIHWRLGTFDDKCIRQACDWIEALLDAHFAGTAINASYDQNIRASLLLGYEGAISSLNHSVGIECLSGIYSHITRASRRSEVNSKANHQGPPVGIYRRESITF